MQNKWRFLIIQVVGYKNSGKTMLMKKLIKQMSENGMRVGTLKHHGHGGEPAIVKDTDSYQHIEAGAAISAVQGENRLQVMVSDTSQYQLNELLQMYTILPIDILLIEGFKQENYPKIVLINSEEDKHLLEELSNIIAVGSWDDSKLKNLHYFTFSLTEIDKCLSELVDCITVN